MSNRVTAVLLLTILSLFGCASHLQVIDLGGPLLLQVRTGLFTRMTGNLSPAGNPGMPWKIILPPHNRALFSLDPMSNAH